MTPTAPMVSVVIPTRDEAANVRPLADRVQAALGETPFELCFVDDSDDATAEEIGRLQLATGEVRCLVRQAGERAGGLSTAVVAGLHMARGRWVCVMDADLQHPPELIPRLLAAGEAGADLVVASRYMRGGATAGLDGVLRRVVSRCAGAVARALFKEARQSSDPLSGFFLCRRAILDGIEFRPVGFKILLELLVCVPGLRVTDVPVAQERRASGSSKAGLRQGLLYLGHLRSLFLDVPGSARRWKFALVGLSGLGLFLPVLWASARAGLSPLLAFVPAFAVSVSWNAVLNWRWTFADQRRTPGSGARRYIDWALVSGVIMFGVFTLLIEDAHLAVLAAGVLAAVTAMLVNAVANRSSVAARPSVWARVALDHGMQAGLRRLASEVGADRAYVIPGDARSLPGVPAGVVSHVVSRRHPLLLTEAPSHRAQRRTNIEFASRLLLPVVAGDAVDAVVVCERHAPRGFDAAALDTATRVVAELLPALAGATAETVQRDVTRLAGSAPEPTSGA